MSKRSTLVLTLTAFLCMLVVSGALAGIGVYKVDGGLTVPATIKYMLNKDAESVTVEICPAGPPLGAAVRSWTFSTGAPECAKGLHQSLVWDGKDNSNNPVPAGNYKVKVTATGAAVESGSTLQPIWESVADTNWRTYGIAVNNNTNSPLYGRIYVAHYQLVGGKEKGVYEFEPDGTPLGKLPDPPSYGASAPWALAIDADDHLYMSDRSNMKVHRYQYNTVTDKWSLIDQFSTAANDRGIATYGSGGTMNFALTYCTPSDPPITNSRIYTATGEPITALNNVFDGVNDYFMQPAIDSEGNIYIAGCRSGANVTPTLGSVSMWTMAGAPIETYSGSGTNRNTNLTSAIGISITPDGNTVWLGRWSTVTGYTDSRDTDPANSTVYKFPLSEIKTIDPYNAPPSSFRNYGVGTAYATKTPVFLAADAAGNIVMTGGATYPANPGRFFGVYEEPTGLPSTNSLVSYNTIHFSGEPSPVFVSGNAVPASIPADGATKSMITVVGEDGDNTVSYNDISFCRFHCPELHYGTAGDLTTGVPMNLIGRSGIQNTYNLEISAATDVPAGDYTATIALYDKHAGVAVGTGTISITVIGGIISGRLTNGETGAPCPNVTVMAKLGAYERTAVTDASGNYSINVTAGAGYVVSPVKGADGVTHPSEYNLQSDWPADPGASDWPKTVDVSLGGAVNVDGRLWPLAITQVTYDWDTSTNRPDNRFVSVIGTVMRAAADTATSQNGFNGYYWIEDTRRAATLQGLKVLTRPGDPVVKEGDKVVIDGMYMKQTNYVTGRMVPSIAPFVKSSNNPIPAAREMLYSSYMGWMTGGLWHIGSVEVKEADAANVRFRVELPQSSTVSNPGSVWIDLDTDVTTGITLPTEGTLVDITGIIDELGPWGTPRMLRPGKPSDVKPTTIVNSLGAAKLLPNQSSVVINIPADNPLIVTSAATYNVLTNTCDWIYVEDSNRVTGIKINGNGLLPANLVIWPGDIVTTRLVGTVMLPAGGGDYELKLSETPTIVESADTSLIPKPIALSNLALGGGWFGSVPAVYDRGEGLNNQGLLATIYGRVTDIIYEVDPVFGPMPSIVFIDDGSGVRGGIAGNPVVEKTGVKCYVGKATIRDPGGPSIDLLAAQPATLTVGDYVVVNGIVGSEWIQPPVNRMRVLRMRFCVDPIAPFEIQFLDQFRIVEDVP